jgi:predicted transcriptional regulator
MAEAEKKEDETPVEPVIDAAKQLVAKKEAAVETTRKIEEQFGLTRDEILNIFGVNLEPEKELAKVKADLAEAGKNAKGYEARIAQLTKQVSEVETSRDDLKEVNDGLAAKLRSAEVTPAKASQEENPGADRNQNAAGEQDSWFEEHIVKHFRKR